MKKLSMMCAGAILFGASSGAMAEDHVVKANITNYDPMILFVAPGDRVTWTNMAGHNVEAIEGMVPEGVELFKSKLGEEGYSMVFDTPGAYVYKCTPHVSTGMVGAVVVGDGEPANMADIQAALDNVKIAKNMVNRGIRKMEKALEKRAAE